MPARTPAPLLGICILAVLGWVALLGGDVAAQVSPEPDRDRVGAADQKGAEPWVVTADEDDAEPEAVTTGRDDTEPDVVVTASRSEADPFEVPYSSSLLYLDAKPLRTSRRGRSLPNALEGEPSVMVQKTGPGQSSPYIRGFTGFRTLMLVDGVRLNNSVFRDGPNQYFGTVDLYSVERLELVRGPTSVLWGSDAIGGTLNAITGKVPAEDAWGGALFTRYSSAERSFIQRVEAQIGEDDVFGLRAGITYKDFGNLKAGSGSGNLPNTNYDEFDYDLRLDMPLEAGVEITAVVQSVHQRDVPRTERTVDSVPFHGTVAGSELMRELDQDRDLAYVRASFEGDGSVYDRGSVTVSWQQQEEKQDRRRTGGRFDTRGFTVDTWGVQTQFETETSIGTLTWGAEAYRDRVSSYRRDFEDGVLTLDAIQGNIGDDADYDTVGVFVQDEISHGDFETVLGARWNYASADADSVDNPNVAGSDPSTPGNIISVDGDWDELVGSVRTTWFLDESSNVYAGISQGFRAPNLSDLTSDLEDSGIESPAPDLDPEHFVAVELGARARHDDWNGEVAVWNTWVDDMIIRSPTGEVIDDTPVFRKDNSGDGRIYGIEARGEYTGVHEWTVFASASFLDGRVDQFRPSGEEVEKPFDRLQPLSALLGATYEPEDSAWWVQADCLMADEADKLSLRDESDVRRIPPGGTPGYAVFGVRSGFALDDESELGVAVENILDKDYRVHGSGQNEIGRSLVLTYARRF